MKLIQLSSTCFFLLFTYCCFGQLKKDFNFADLSIEKKDSMIHSVFAYNLEAYESFKVALPIEKRHKIIQSTILGSLIGFAIGISIEGLIESTCEISRISGGSVCEPNFNKAGLIGGFLGTGVGLTIGLNKSKKIKFQPVFIY